MAISERKSGAIKLTKLGPAEEPRNLRKIKNEVGRRWGSVPLIDMLKEAVLRTGCLNAVTSVVGSSSLNPEVLAERLMLAIFGYGTNTERGSMVVHSQTLRASASEVHAMIEGAVRHGTTMKVEGNYVDSRGQTEIGFGVTRLLGFDLLPRIKRINKVKLYRVESGESDLYPRLTPAMTRPIKWEVIEHNYDQMIKYATAIKQGTASTEAILRRFTESASHPTYQAMLEVGRAQKTIFVPAISGCGNSSGRSRKGSTWWSPPTGPTASFSTARAAPSPPTGARSWR
ncbi:hypothetical protein GCM10020001_113940 [Nonomuraea salmonea]